MDGSPVEQHRDDGEHAPMRQLAYKPRCKEPCYEIPTANIIDVEQLLRQGPMRGEGGREGLGWCGRDLGFCPLVV